VNTGMKNYGNPGRPGNGRPGMNSLMLIVNLRNLGIDPFV